MSSDVPATRRRRQRVIGLAATLAIAGLLVPGASATAQTAGGIGLRPAHVDPADPATRAYFKRSVVAGASFTDQVVVTNTSDAAIDLLVSGVDGRTATTSGAVYANRQDPVDRAGAWVVPSAPNI